MDLGPSKSGTYGPRNSGFNPLEIGDWLLGCVEDVFDTFIGEMFFLGEPVAARAVELLEAA